MKSEKETTVTKVYKVLKDQIIKSKMVPGQLLMAQQIAIDYNVSRTPVREALIRLKGEGLIEDAGGNKFKVAPLSWKMIEDSYEARGIIEGACIEYAAKNATAAQIEILDDLLKKMRAVKEDSAYGKYYELDARFHFEIVRIMNNDILIDYMRKNADGQQRIRFYTRGINSDIKLSLAEHE
ncbi:MAG: GntR family transcriptional regulator, partial [Erysipelotrichaceae bacterium]|nr:GntR family transcriptional regulator [Erysipelotrichaceae bacterium]